MADGRIEWQARFIERDQVRRGWLLGGFAGRSVPDPASTVASLHVPSRKDAARVDVEPTDRCFTGLRSVLRAMGSDGGLGPGERGTLGPRNRPGGAVHDMEFSTSREDMIIRGRDLDGRK
jgi:hypothetical protein